MNNELDIAKGSISQIVQQAINVINRPKDFKNIFLLLFYIVLFSSIVIPTGIRVLFRKHIGEAQRNIFPIIVTSLAFGALSVAFVFNPEDIIEVGLLGVMPFSGIVVGTFFLIIAISILIKGFSYSKKEKQINVHPESQGETIWFSSWIKEDSHPLLLPLAIEPIYLIFIGAILSLYNIMGGMVLAICGASIWMNYLILQIIKWLSNSGSVNSNSTNRSAFR